MKKLVYIASPYTKGDPAINTRFQCEMFDELLSSGLVLPYAPLWSHFQHTMFPRDYKDWVEYDLDFIRKAGFDACLRLASVYEPLDYFQVESSGADGEVELFRELGLPVFTHPQPLLEWASL